MSTIRVNRFENTSGTAYGCILQVVKTQDGSLQTMSTTVPHDDTIPTSSEGTELSSLNTTITPKKVGNLLRVTANIVYGCTANVNIACCLFKDAGASAVAVVDHAPFTGGLATLSLIYYETVSSVSATTFKLRLGGASASTIYLNGLTGARVFGGTSCSTMTIEEIQV